MYVEVAVYINQLVILMNRVAKIHTLVFLVLSAVLVSSQCYALCLVQSPSSPQIQSQPCDHCPEHNGSQQSKSDCPHGHADLASAESALNFSTDSAGVTASPIWTALAAAHTIDLEPTLHNLGKPGFARLRLLQSIPLSFSILRL
jgi:hypothetical protein